MYIVRFYTGGTGMPNYQEMYVTLFRRVTAAINELQEAQQQTEEMYISSAPTNIRVIDTDSTKDAKPDTE